MKLKATKTSLYKLVSEYTPLPNMKRTEFVKVPRVRPYFCVGTAIKNAMLISAR